MHNSTLLNARRIALVASVLSAVVAPQVALAQFVPGRIYIAASSDTACGGNPDDPNIVPGQIREFDPTTGTNRLFAQMPPDLCGAISGLAFTPDGSRLRVSNLHQNAILEIDGDGNISTALDASDGINAPLGSNNIAYDDAGNFYVAQRGLESRGIFQFPAGGGPPIEFAGPTDGITDSGALAFASDGSLYFTRNNRDLWRFTNPHTGGVFDSLPFGVSFASIAAGSSGTVFASAGNGIYRYQSGVPDSGQLLSTLVGLEQGSLALSPDESSLYLIRNNAVFSIDAESGDFAMLGLLSNVPGFLGSGSAVYVPEPTTLVPVILGLPWLGRPRK